MQLEFLSEFAKNPHISNFMKILPVEAEFFHVVGQTNLIVAFRNFSNAPKNCHQD
jgi:hypothetical protein